MSNELDHEGIVYTIGEDPESDFLAEETIDPSAIIAIATRRGLGRSMFEERISHSQLKNLQRSFDLLKMEFNNIRNDIKSIKTAMSNLTNIGPETLLDKNNYDSLRSISVEINESINYLLTNNNHEGIPILEEEDLANNVHSSILELYLEIYANGYRIPKPELLSDGEGGIDVVIKNRNIDILINYPIDEDRVYISGEIDNEFTTDLYTNYKNAIPVLIKWLLIQLK